MSFMGDEKACGEVEVEEVTEWYDCSGEEEVEELTDWYDVTVPFSTTDRSARPANFPRREEDCHQSYGG
jgi:hypothetical protein